MSCIGSLRYIGLQCRYAKITGINKNDSTQLGLHSKSMQK